MPDQFDQELRPVDLGKLVRFLKPEGMGEALLAGHLPYRISSPELLAECWLMARLYTDARLLADVAPWVMTARPRPVAAPIHVQVEQALTAEATAWPGAEA